MTEPHKSSDRPGSPRPSGSGAPEEERSLLTIPSISIGKSPSGKSPSDRVRKLLESLEAFDSLYICPLSKQLPNAVKSRVHRPVVRKYELRDYYGVSRYYAVELTSRCCYCCCSNSRPFEILMFDTSGELVFECARECSGSLLICGVDSCCGGGVETVANFRHGENFIGGVLAESSCRTPTFAIQNEFCDEKFVIRGPKMSHIFPCRLCCVKSFAICLPQTDVSVGRIMLGYDGLTDDLVPNKDTVGVIFPPRCSAEVKACLLAAGFMLDITYFNQRGVTLHRFIRHLFGWVLLGLLIFLIWFGVFQKNGLRKIIN